MIDKKVFDKYKNDCLASDAMGINYYAKSPNVIQALRRETERFINTYRNISANECYILGLYIERFIKKGDLSGIDMKFVIEILNLIESDFERKIKNPKLFISHSTKDVDVVEAFVDMLIHFGLNEKNLFCSSIPGYNIKQGKGNIYDYLRSELEENIFVVLMLSDNYYRSCACLNEMGAMWVNKKK